MGFAVDSNCVCGFQMERVCGTAARFSEAVSNLLRDRVLLLDDTGKCQQEWMETAAGPLHLNLADWVSDLIVSGNARLVTLTPLGRHRRPLQQLGLSNKDMKWFNLCRDGGAAVFLTEDIDFYDPRAKQHSPARKERIRRNGPAPVKRFFRREINTEVMDLADVLAA